MYFIKCSNHTKLYHKGHTHGQTHIDFKSEHIRHTQIYYSHKALQNISVEGETSNLNNQNKKFKHNTFTNTLSAEKVLKKYNF